MKDKIVEVDNVSFSYNTNKVLDNVSFYIEEGDFVGIIGPNGSAKSTLLKLMLGLLKTNQGTIRLFNRNINNFKDFEKIGYISQNAREFNQMFPATVEEVLAASLYSKRWFFKKSTKDDNLRIEEALQIVEMNHFRKRKIGNLSGGQKQRVFIARALVNNPKILFMDEPLVGVDLESQTNFYSLMDKLNRGYNMTLVMISHDIGVISQKVNRILCLSNGKVYCHSGNKHGFNSTLKNIYGENMDILFHDH